MYWGIDLGGTKIEGVVLEDKSPDSVIARHRLDTQGQQGYNHVLERIRMLVEILKEQSKLRPSHIGFGTPGTIDPGSGLLKNSNTLCLNGRPLAADLKDMLHIDTEIANDANCFALAEFHMGAIAHNFPEAKVVFGVIMGTGVGGGIVVNGNIIRGHHGIGGEWGHMFLDESGEDCYCGRHGCVETIISGPALERFYFSKTGVKKKLAEILKENNETSAELKKRLIHFFGKGIGQIINVLDPDVIVIGGGLGNIDFLYSEGVESASHHIFNTTLTTPIVKPMLGDSAGVFGAAMLTY